MIIRAKHTVLEFGPFRLDRNNRVLTRDGKPVPLTPKVFDTLLLLVENRGRLLEKTELMDELWPDSFVEENSLTKSVSSVRKALGEAANGAAWIGTVPGRGYRFQGEVREVVPESLARRMTHRWWRRAATAAILIAAGAVLLPRVRSSLRPVSVNAPIRRLTSSGDALRAAISPDGRYLAIVRGEIGSQALALRDLAANSETEVDRSHPLTYQGLSFSPDGTYLWAVLRWNPGLTSALFRSSRSGGEWQKMTEDVDSPVAFSPDGQRYAFIRETASTGRTTLVIRDSRGQEAQLASRTAPEALDYPTWAPGGDRIACTLIDKAAHLTGIVSISTANGSVSEWIRPRWRFVRDLRWRGGRLFLTAREPKGESFQIWAIPLAPGKERRLTNDLEYYDSFDITRDGRTIVAVQSRTLMSLWAVGASTGANARQIAGGSHKYADLAATPEGRLLFAYGAGNATDIWSMNPDGSGALQLTHGGNNHKPRVCGTDGTVAYNSELENGFETRLMRGGDSPPQSLFRHRGISKHDCSPDGKWVVHTATDGGWQKLWRTSTDGQRSEKLSEGWADSPEVSPDGRWIAAFYAERPASTQSAPNAIAIVPFTGGVPSKLFPIDDAVNHIAGVHWTPDGTAISYVRNEGEVGNVWVQPIAGGAPHSLTHLMGERIFYFGWSRDGRTLFVTRGSVAHDIVLLQLGTPA